MQNVQLLQAPNGATMKVTKTGDDKNKAHFQAPVGKIGASNFELSDDELAQAIKKYDMKVVNSDSFTTFKGKENEPNQNKNLLGFLSAGALAVALVTGLLVFKGRSSKISKALEISQKEANDTQKLYDDLLLNNTDELLFNSSDDLSIFANDTKIDAETRKLVEETRKLFEKESKEAKAHSEAIKNEIKQQNIKHFNSLSLTDGATRAELSEIIVKEGANSKELTKAETEFLEHLSRNDAIFDLKFHYKELTRSTKEHVKTLQETIDNPQSSKETIEKAKQQIAKEQERLGKMIEQKDLWKIGERETNKNSGHPTYEFLGITPKDEYGKPITKLFEDKIKHLKEVLKTRELVKAPVANVERDIQYYENALTVLKKAQAQK